MFIYFLKQVISNKTIARTLFNIQVKKNCSNIVGRVLDIASGINPGYKKCLPKDIDYIASDFKTDSYLDMIIDFNNKLNFKDQTFENIFLFNAIYIVKDRIGLLKEIKRIIKDNGTLFLSSPFIANEMKEPDDFCRLTAQGLEDEFKEAGFGNIKIIRYGERFSSALYLINSLIKTPILKIIFYPIALSLDYLIPKKIKQNYPCPLGYFCIIKK